MKAIWKFPLELTHEQIVDCPEGLQVLHVDVQAGRICLWGVVETGALRGGMTVFIVGTGGPMPERELCHMGTVQLGPYVWHVFTPTGRR